MPTIYTFMASCRLGYLELDSSGNSGKLLVVLIRVRVTRCTKQASGSYDLLVIYLEQLSAEVADLFGVGAGLAVLVLVLVIFRTPSSERWQTSSVEVLGWPYWYW